MDSEQQEIKEAEVRFLAPEEIAGFVYSTLERHLPNSLARTSDEFVFDVMRSEGLRDALRGLVTAYPATHHARTEISRFRNRIASPAEREFRFWESAKVWSSFMFDIPCYCWRGISRVNRSPTYPGAWEKSLPIW